MANTRFVTPGNSDAQGAHFSAAIAGAGFVNHLSGHVLAIADANGADNSTPFCKFQFEGLGT